MLTERRAARPARLSSSASTPPLGVLNTRLSYVHLVQVGRLPLTLMTAHAQHVFQDGLARGAGLLCAQSALLVQRRTLPEPAMQPHVRSACRESSPPIPRSAALIVNLDSLVHSLAQPYVILVWREQCLDSETGSVQTAQEGSGAYSLVSVYWEQSVAAAQAVPWFHATTRPDRNVTSVPTPHGSLCWASGSSQFSFCTFCGK